MFKTYSEFNKINSSLKKSNSQRNIDKTFTSGINHPPLNDSFQKINMMQSPKINNKKFRSSSQSNQLCCFSEKSIKNVNGTKLPIQYKRRTLKELNELFKKRREYSIFEFINEKKEKTPLIVKNKTKLNEECKVQMNAENEEKKTEEIKENKIFSKTFYNPQPKLQRNNSTASFQNRPRLSKQKLITEYKNKTHLDNNEPNENNINNGYITQYPLSKNNTYFSDVNKPNGYNQWEESRYVKRAQSGKVNFPGFAKSLTKRNYESDIFYLKGNPENITIYKQKKEELPYYAKSDIFNLQKDNKFAELKSGEKCLFRVKNPNRFFSQNESNSYWSEKGKMPTTLNHSSTSYNILCPSIKGFSMTKEEIQNECNKVSPNHPIFNRQKSLCEYTDIMSFARSNNSTEYQKALKSNTGNPFAKTSEVCGDYNKMYEGYQTLCDKPFKKVSMI